MDAKAKIDALQKERLVLETHIVWLTTHQILEDEAAKAARLARDRDRTRRHSRTAGFLRQYVRDAEHAIRQIDLEIAALRDQDGDTDESAH